MRKKASDMLAWIGIFTVLMAVGWFYLSYLIDNGGR